MRLSTASATRSSREAPATVDGGLGPELPQGKLVTATSPQTVLALICSGDFGAAVAATVAEPGKFHEAEIDFAGDALTHPEIADTLSKAAGRETAAVSVSWEEQEQRLGAPWRTARSGTTTSATPHAPPRGPLRPDHDYLRAVGSAAGLDHPGCLNSGSLPASPAQR
ncbi:NmrA family NAD(P)-binding protein [Streptomyces sp. NPDC057298]|uniref:NmrA family NAD(P)-binding protein n=1 Tax=Streptomyces sp. NPDC057298 TaxID=3346091 RepID=UPI0036388B0A